MTLHELGHTLGLGHATNLLERTDLMGYGWPELGDPVLSQCDVDALAFVFAWALEGSDPYPPGEAPTTAEPDPGPANGRGARPVGRPGRPVLRACRPDGTTP